MDRQKMLPPVPAYETSVAEDGSFSPDTYIQLLEHENEQLRLRIQEMVKQLRAAERKAAAEVNTTTSLKKDVKMMNTEIRRRDETIASIAGGIVQEFQRYTDSVQDLAQDEGYIPIGFSCFDQSS